MTNETTSRIWSAIYLLLTFFLMSLYFKFQSALMSQLPVHALLVPIIASSLVMFFVQRSQLSWIMLGKIERYDVMWIILISSGAAGALLIWASSANTFGYAEQTMTHLRGIPFWLVGIIGIPVFAIFMALAEEVLYRGIMLETISRITGSWWIAAILQASVYGGWHAVDGFPNGPVGFVMVFVYGILLAVLKRKTKGLLAPYITHVIADLTIGYFLIYKFL